MTLKIPPQEAQASQAMPASRPSAVLWQATLGETQKAPAALLAVQKQMLPWSQIECSFPRRSKSRVQPLSRQLPPVCVLSPPLLQKNLVRCAGKCVLKSRGLLVVCGVV